jgi:predicted TIM-barrel fold metal-dependent hydrolase
MTPQRLETPAPTAARPSRDLRVIDSDAHNWPMPDDLAPYLSSRWRDYLDLVGLRTPAEVGLVRAKPLASRTDAWSPRGNVPGNDPVFFREDFLDRHGIDLAILNNLAMAQQSLVGGNQPLEFTAELMRAANEWTLEHFIEADDRLYSSICTPFENGAPAIAEIERVAGNPRFLQVLIPFRTQRPIGNPKYWDIFEAAVHHGLPIAFHPGTIGNNPVTGAGWPSYYFEDHVGYPGALMAQLASLIAEGVFEQFPSLQIVFQEGGWSWVQPFAWRLDRACAQLAAEVPHLKRTPSEYIRDHVWYTTQPIEEPGVRGQFEEAIEVLGGTDHLLYSSDYPHWDFDPPDHALPKSLDPEVTRAIMGGNAARLYGFDGGEGGN